MDSKTKEKVDSIANQPIRPDVEDKSSDNVSVEPSSKKEPGRLARGVSEFLTMANLMSKMRGNTTLTGIPQKTKVFQPNSVQRKKLAKKKRLRRFSKLARRNNRGVKGYTQLQGRK